MIYHMNNIIKNEKHASYKHDIVHQIDELIMYENFHFIWNNSITNKGYYWQYFVLKNYNKPLHIFLIGGVGIGNPFTFIRIIQNTLRYYVGQIKNANPLKTKIMKSSYYKKNNI
jgi:hypothetical protein